ncbi:S41 family peptidase [Thalassobellus sediminis]|uniref:S41 family peptidase n=1 Tax=Thalassobellus sediminis TaxID=3367753 RepID=UPI0037A4709E
MKNIKALVLILIVAISTVSCFEDNDDNIVSASQINDFVWKGMNVFYLYKENISNLANDRFTNNGEYANYLNSFNSPEQLFESLIYERQTIDRFSWIVDDYFELENQFNGISNTNGIEFGFFSNPNIANEGIGVIKLVLPNSPGDIANLKRGDIFYGINGQRLTNQNINELLSQETYTLNLGFYNDKGTPETTDDSIDPLNEDITLTKVQYTENPVYQTNIFNIGGKNVGYLIYNEFNNSFETQLNDAFGEFKSNNIQHLVLDLRYNPGGRVSTGTFLASMITGQFTGEIFSKVIYNEDLQEANNIYTFDTKIENGNTINSLNLQKLYVLTTSRSASASEGLINGLAPFIEIVQIGTNTTGKTQASITIYDSEDFGRQGANPNHTYAMQPLVANAINKNDVAVPGSGLTPSIGFEYQENPFNYGTLGDINEPLLAIALADIENSTSKISKIKSKDNSSLKLIFDSNDLNPYEGGMRIE